MRRALRRAGCAAAGLLGLSAPALAQYGATPPAPTSYLTPALAPGSPYGVIGQTALVQLGDEELPAPVVVATNHARLEEMKVELAWLADPVTFPYHLAAQAEGAGLKLRGFVLNEAVKARALKVAQSATALPITEELRLHRTLAGRTVGVPADTVQQEALELLAQAVGERALGLDVKAKPSGQVVLTGSIPSYEEKLAISRLLRRVRGCTSVVNQLTVVTVMKDGKAFTMVTADGQQLLPPDELPEGLGQKPTTLTVVPPKDGPDVGVATPTAVQGLPPGTVSPAAAPAEPSAVKQPPSLAPRTLPLALPPVPKADGKVSFPNSSKLPPTSSSGASGVVTFTPESPEPPANK